MKNKISFLVIVSVLLAEPSFAQVYKWVDEKGAIHFTDDTMQIPERYRPKTEKMGIVIENRDLKSDPPNEKDRSPSKTKDEPYKDRLGRGEEYWKARVESWKKKLTGAQDQAETLRMKYNDLTEKLNSSKSSVERAVLRNERDQVRTQLVQFKQQVEEAKVMIERKLPEEAELFKAKPDWVRP